MATPPTLVQFAFAAGLDESQQGEVLDPMQGFAMLQNGRQDRRGGFTKRLGFGSFAKTRLDATSRSAGYRLFDHYGQNCIADGSTLDSYSPTAAINVSCGRLPECTLEYLPLPNTSFTTSIVVDSVMCGSYFAIMYRVGSASDLYVAILDTASGTVVRGPERVFTGSGLMLGALATYGTRIFAFSLDFSGGTANIAYRIINTSTASTINTGWLVSANAATDGRTGTPILATCSLSNRVAVVYGNTSAGTSRLTVVTLDSTGVLQTQTINTSSTTPNAASIEGSIADTLWIAWNEATSIKVIGLNASSLSTILAAAVPLITTSTTPGIDSSIDVMSSMSVGAGRVFVNDTNGGRMYAQSFITVGGVVVANGGQALVYNSQRASRIFKVAGRYYALCSHTHENYAIVCDLSEATAYVRPIANLLPRGTVPTVARDLRVEVVGSTAWVVLSQISEQENIYALKVAKLDFASEHRFRTAAHAGCTFLSGGLLSVFDGLSVREAGFLIAPHTPQLTLSGTGLTGTFRYVATYEQVDAAGRWHISSVSNPSGATSPANQTVNVEVRPLSMSSRVTQTTDPGVRISIYRTATGGEAPYYYLTSLDNDLSAGTQSYADQIADATLTQGALLLGSGNLPGTNGATQDHRAPIGLRYLVSYNGVLVGSQGEDLFFSGQDVSGEGTWFSPVFEVPVSGGGSITGLAAQDGTLYIFKLRDIFAVAGDPPTDNGASGGLGTPRRLAVDVGCIDARSIVVTSLGIFFQSERGIELLSRAGAVQWIGEGVQNTLATYPVISSAVLDDRNGLVRFSLATSQSSGLVTGAGRDLVFDLVLGTWQSVDDKTGTSSHQASQDAAMIYVSGSWRYAWLGTDGTVYYERSSSDSDAYLDGSTWVTMTAETAWLKMGGIQGKQHVNKVLLLARKNSRADLYTHLSYDYATSFKTSYGRLADDIDTLSTAIDRIQIEHQLHDEAEGQAIKVKFEDATPTNGTVGNGKGATWIALTFEGVPRQGAIGVPEAGM